MKKILSLILISVMFIAGMGGCTNGAEDASSLTVFGWSLASVKTAKKTNSPIYSKIKEATGIDIDVKSVNSSAFDEALNKLFNTGELTDLFISYGPEKAKLYKKMIDDGAILPVSDYVSESKYPNLYKHLSKYTFLAENLYYSQGKQWSIPTNFSLEHSIYVRADWIENLNKTEKLTAILTEELGRAPDASELENMKFVKPTNIVEFYRLARAFTKYDPDGNGKNDTYGYTSTSDMWSDNWIQIAFSGGYQMMIPDGNGGYTTSSTSDGVKEAIAFMNRLHNEHIMHPDWQTDTFSDKQDKFCQGKVGMIECHNWFNNIVTGYVSINSSVSIEDASERIAMINPPAGKEGNFGISGHPGFWTVVCINANMSKEKIDKALTLMDYLYSDQGQNLFIYGIEGENYKVEKNEKVSTMGKNTAGFNYTMDSYDAAYPLSSYCNWTANYFSPYATNADKIIKQMDAAASYATYDEHPMVQTQLYVNNWESMKSYAEECFMDMITSSNCYNDAGYTSQFGAVSWENLVKISSTLDGKWNNFKSKYLGDYSGQAVINEYNEYIKKLAK